jgi:YHS domain-containing protein
MPSRLNIGSATLRLLAAFFVLCGMFCASAQAADERVAIQGYDPVAYFTNSEAVEGNPQITFSWDGAIYRFASNDHRVLFKDNPEKYAPLYRGYCTVALGRGVRFLADPEKWLIHDGRLHIFGHSVDIDAARQEIAKTKKAADENYKRLAELPIKVQNAPKQ